MLDPQDSFPLSVNGFLRFQPLRWQLLRHSLIYGWFNLGVLEILSYFVLNLERSLTNWQPCADINIKTVKKRLRP